MSTVAHENNHHDEHHHEESFVSKYIFSQDHKMIGKQFLLTAVFMGIVAMMLSIFFRIQLAWPGEESTFLNTFLETIHYHVQLQKRLSISQDLLTFQNILF